MRSNATQCLSDSQSDRVPMSVALICGSLESGCDGVGDYSRELAAELIRQGHDSCLISLADQGAKGVAEEMQHAGDVSVRALRIPVSVPWPQRVAAARRFMERAGVSQISFQFVPYTYSPKGVVRTAVPFLVRLAEGRKVHMMFHELWIGNSMNSSFKHRLVGALQRHYVLGLVRKLVPAAVHTSNPVYVAFLARYGISARILPLFGSVPVQADAGAEQAFDLFRQYGVDLSLPDRRAYWVGGIFGSITSEWTPEPFFSELAQVAAREKKMIVIAGIGRLGAKGDAKWSEMVRTYADRFRFALVGPLPVETISPLFRVLDFGISTTSWRVFGKSSASASMTDHGLPVIVIRDDWRPRPALDVAFNYPPVVRRFEPGTINDFAGFLANKREPFSTRPEVAKRFIDSLASS